ncbi:MAG TPA: sugar kinase [Candidatus Limnocylindrales bacterium]|jgi:sugar/nucleoside kinase (ribokinase family)|nr:sugar kinase [Candidatus Limnocylindrales bacterium]
MVAAERDLDLLVVGEINPDVVVVDADPVPVFGERERVVEAVRLTVGSSSAIAACGAARLGLRVAFAGVVGDDAFGRFMLEAMAARGIDVSSCTIDPSRPTGATVILTSGHDRAMLTALGTIGELDLDAVPASVVGRTRHVHSGAFFLQGAGRERLPSFLEAARAIGATTSFDTNWDPDERWDGVAAMLRAADLFFPNAAEVRRIAGIDDVERAARELARIGVEGRADGGPLVVVKLGVEGALACRADGPFVRTPAMPIDPRDTTGAGDSFNAGFLRAWLDGGSTVDALRYAAACGALSTRGLGGVDAQPTPAEVMSALAGWAAG